MRKALTLGIACLLTLAAFAPAAAEGPTVHTVRPGENLFRIGLRYGLTVDALSSANGIRSSDRIFAGQRLTIPGYGSTASAPASAAPSGYHIVQRGENLSRIALRYGVTTRALAAANGIVNPNHVYVGQRLAIHGAASSSTNNSVPATASSGSYVVRRGDSLSAIARRCGVSMWTLAQLNGIRNPSFIYVGQTIRVPSATPAASSGPAAPTTPAQPPAPAPASPQGSGRWIDLDLSGQRITAYEGRTAVRSTLVSTGLARTPTPTGQFRIYVKYRADDMAGPGYYLPDVPYTMYFYRGYGIHGTYWHSNFGHPMSHGCVNLPTSEAQWFFNWSSVGTLVNIHY
jgi:LysM repeat protein